MPRGHPPLSCQAWGRDAWLDPSFEPPTGGEITSGMTFLHLECKAELNR